MQELLLQHHITDVDYDYIIKGLSQPAIANLKKVFDELEKEDNYYKDFTFKPVKKPKIKNIEACDAVKLPHSRFSVDGAEYLIFKCNDMLFVQKVEDSTRAK
jgi:hypothetical protein